MNSEFTDSEIDQMMDFFKLAAEICSDRGRAHSFTCPICGATAQAERAPSNGHLHANCPGCGVGVVE